MAPIGNPDPRTLGERHDVGGNAVVLRGEHAAGAADAALHLVEDQEDSVLVADRAQPGKETRGRHQVAAFALERLDQDRGDFLRWQVALEEHPDVGQHGLALVGPGEERPVHVWIGDVHYAGHGRSKARLLCVLARREG
jgi:hypothetical protein